MSYMPSNDEIRLYVTDEGQVQCHMGCDYWVISDDLDTRRVSLADLIDTIRQHVAMKHAGDQQPDRSHAG